MYSDEFTSKFITLYDTVAVRVNFFFDYLVKTRSLELIIFQHICLESFAES